MKNDTLNQTTRRPEESDLRARVSALEGSLARLSVFHHPGPFSSHAARVATPSLAASDGMVRRIIKAYKSSMAGNPTAGDSQWSLFLQNFNKPIHKALLQNDLNAVQEALSNPAYNNIFYGFENIRIDYTEQCAGDPNACLWYAEQIHDNLICLAEAVGVIPITNPEAFRQNSTGAMNPDSILSLLDERFGFRVDFPNPYKDEFGLETSRGVAGYRSIQALWQAWRIVENLRRPADSHVLEIGAGLGRTAYYAKKFGIPAYTIVDLPFTAISSAYYLGCTLGEENIRLSGEFEAAASIRIVSPETFLNGNFKFDLIANFDSFTEIDKSMATQYWNQIFRQSPIFLSINHEVNSFRVADFYLPRPDVYKVNRHPCWLRRGYVEEIVRLS